VSYITHKRKDLTDQGWKCSTAEVNNWGILFRVATGQEVRKSQEFSNRSGKVRKNHENCQEFLWNNNNYFFYFFHFEFCL
jgi:hypothetical protein